VGEGPEEGGGGLISFGRIATLPIWYIEKGGYMTWRISSLVMLFSIEHAARR
jgi:hypothetical protein